MKSPKKVDFILSKLEKNPEKGLIQEIYEGDLISKKCNEKFNGAVGDARGYSVDIMLK